MRSINLSMKLLALLLCFLVASPFANGADRKKDNKKKKKGQPTAVVADSTKQQPKGIPSLADFIKPAAKRHAGMVNIYEQQMTPETVQKLLTDVFRTETGKNLCKTMLCLNNGQQNAGN